MKSILRLWVYFLSRQYLMLKNRTVTIKTGARVGIKSSFEGKNAIGKNSAFSGTMGRCSYIGSSCNINGVIGRYTCIGGNVKTLSSTHPTQKFVSINPMFYSNQKQNGYTYVDKNYFDEMTYVDDEKHSVIIGNDVWIGSDVTILGGITIGDGAVIATGSVVTKNVKPFEIVGGVPAKRIRMRFDEEQIFVLVETKWWDKSETWIKENVLLFHDINNYLEAMCNK